MRPLAKSPLGKNIPRFYLGTFLYNLMFFMPIWVIFLQQKHGLTLTQVTLVDFAFWMTMALTEVPTGAVADTLGRKTSMVLGYLLSIVSILLFGLAPTYPLLLLANSLWGVAITFLSGADMAFFYDTLQALGRQEEYKRRRGHLQALSVIGMGIGNGLGGLLATVNMTSPFILYAVMVTLGLLVTLSFKEPPPSDVEEGQTRPSYAQVLRTAYAVVSGSIELRYLLVYSNLLPLANAAIQITFIQPHALAIGVPLAAIGLVVFGIHMVRLFGSATAEAVPRLVGEWRTLALAPLFLTAGVLGLALIPSLAGVAVYTLAAYASVVTRPLIEDMILRQLSAGVRATVLSIDNLIFRLLLAGIEPLAGMAADRWGLPAAFVLMGGAVGAGLAVLVGMWQRSRAGREGTKRLKHKEHEG